MYNSPIEVLIGDIQSQVRKGIDEEVFQAVVQVGVKVDKEELLRALQYDRQQYEKGLADATPKWISVTERMPQLHLDDYEEPDGGRTQFEVSYDQWVYTASGNQTKARYESGPVFQGWVGEWGKTIRDVTHWMELPLPPEEVLSNE